LPRRGHPPAQGAIYNAALHFNIPVTNAGRAIRVSWGAKMQINAFMQYEAALYIFWLTPLIAPLIGLGCKEFLQGPEKWYFHSLSMPMHVTDRPSGFQTML